MDTLARAVPRICRRARPTGGALAPPPVYQQCLSSVAAAAVETPVAPSGGGVGPAAGTLPMENREWSPEARRCGILAMKVKKDDTDGYTAVQTGVGERKRKNVVKPLMGHFDKVGVEPKREVQEFRVTPDALLPPGFRMRALHFVPGQLVDVCGTTKGKGFQGAMKRWGFAGQPASHGVSKTHRHIGSTGQCQNPGRVFKGKKMPGRMGGDRRTVQNLKILKIDPVRELLYVKGAVPGNKGGFVRVTDAVKGACYPSDPPFPSYEGGGDETEELWCPQGDDDPLRDPDLE